MIPVALQHDHAESREFESRRSSTLLYNNLFENVLFCLIFVIYERHRAMLYTFRTPITSFILTIVY